MGIELPVAPEDLVSPAPCPSAGSCTSSHTTRRQIPRHSLSAVTAQIGTTRQAYQEAARSGQRDSTQQGCR